MKLFKLFPMVALLLALCVNSAFAEKDSKENTGGVQCEVSAARIAQKQSNGGKEASPSAKQDEQAIPANSTRAL